MKKTTFAVIVGNRGFFPDALAKQSRNSLYVAADAGIFTKLRSSPR